MPAEPRYLVDVKGSVMKKKAIYEKQPETIRYLGYRYVLAKREDEEDAPEEGEEEVSPAKRGGSSVRVRIDECRGNSVTFDIRAIVHSYDGAGIPGLDRSDEAVKRRNFRIKPIRKVNDIPGDILAQIESAEGGDALMQRIEKFLRVRPSPPLYYISANGGWNWAKRNGDKDVAMIQGLLEFLRSRRAILFSYCNNKIDYGSNPGLI